MSECKRLDFVIERIDFARKYTLSLLEDIDDDQWFTSVGDGLTHVAWQVGHLASAQYSLCIVRMRGAKPEDEQVISASFRELFRKGSLPKDEAGQYPSPAEIREVAARVHACRDVALLVEDGLPGSKAAGQLALEQRLGLLLAAREIEVAGHEAIELVAGLDRVAAVLDAVRPRLLGLDGCVG